MKRFRNAALCLMAAVCAGGCAPSEQERLSRTWECGQITLSFTEGGTYTITSTATNPPGTWHGKYSVRDNKISVEDPTAYPLDRYTNIEAIGPKDLLLSVNQSDILSCSLKR